MSFVELFDGPCDRHLAPLDSLAGNRVELAVQELPKLSMKFVKPGAPIDYKSLPPIRTAVYELTDSESLKARFIGWKDELPDPWPELTQALGNATDDEILKLMDDLRQDADR